MSFYQTNCCLYFKQFNVFRSTTELNLINVFIIFFPHQASSVMKKIHN